MIFQFLSPHFFLWFFSFFFFSEGLFKRFAKICLVFSVMFLVGLRFCERLHNPG